MKLKPGQILESGYDKSETQQQRLITVLGELEDEVEKQNSFSHIFVRGALYGLGTVIGATILLAILGSGVAMVVRTLGIENVPFLGQFIERAVTEEIRSQSPN
jgi:hypothetical protein